MKCKLALVAASSVCLLGACSSDPNTNAMLTQTAQSLLQTIAGPLAQGYGARLASPHHQGSSPTVSGPSQAGSRSSAAPLPSPSPTPPPLPGPPA
jgi:hypothetical protein